MQDARFVEERRLRLQKYLRHVVNHIVQENIQDDESPNREMLIRLLPFFGYVAEFMLILLVDLYLCL